MSALAVTVAQYGPGDPVLPPFEFEILGRRISAMAVHNPIIVGLASTSPGPTLISRATLTLNLHVGAPLGDAGRIEMTTDGRTFNFTARTAANIGPGDWLVPPGNTQADWDEAAYTLARAIREHPYLGAKYDVDVGAGAGVATVVVQAKEAGPAFNFTAIALGGIPFGGGAGQVNWTNQQSGAPFDADTYDDWRAWLDVMRANNGVERYGGYEIYAYAATTSEVVGRLEELWNDATFDAQNILRYDLSGLLKPLLQTYAPDHALAAPALEMRTCRNLILSVFLRFGDEARNGGYWQGGEAGKLYATPNFTGYNGRKLFILNAALPANARQQDIADACLLRVMQGTFADPARPVLYLTNQPGGNDFARPKLTQIWSVEWLYFVYTRVQTFSYTYFLRTYCEFEDGSIIPEQFIPLQVNVDGAVAAAFPATVRGAALRVEAGLRPLLAHLGLSLEQLETNQNSRVALIRCHVSEYDGITYRQRTADQYYEYDNDNRCIEPNELYFLNRWGGFDTVPLTGDLIVSAQPQASRYGRTLDVAGRGVQDKARAHDGGAFQYDGALTLEGVTGWVSEHAQTWLEELTTSTEVYLRAPQVQAMVGAADAPYIRVTIDQTDWRVSRDQSSYSLRLNMSVAFRLNAPTI